MLRGLGMKNSHSTMPCRAHPSSKDMHPRKVHTAIYIQLRKHYTRVQKVIGFRDTGQ